MSVPYFHGREPYRGPTGRVSFDWFGESWQIFGRAPVIWIGALLIYFTAYLAMFVPFELWLQQSNPLLSPGAMNSSSSMYAGTMSIYASMFRSSAFWGFELAIILFMSFTSGSLLRLALKQVRHEPVTFGDAFSGGSAMGRMILFYLLAGLINLAATGVIGPIVVVTRGANIVAIVVAVLLMVGAMLVTWALLLPAFAMVADGAGPITAVKMSVQSMRGDWVTSVIFVLTLFFVLLLSELPCLLGLFVTVPMTCIVSVLAYRDMAGMSGIQRIGQGIPEYGPYDPGVWPPPPGAVGQPSFGQSTFGISAEPPFQQPPTAPAAQLPIGEEPSQTGHPE